MRETIVDSYLSHTSKSLHKHSFITLQFLNYVKELEKNAKDLLNAKVKDHYTNMEEKATAQEVVISRK